MGSGKDAVYATLLVPCEGRDSVCDRSLAQVMHIQVKHIQENTLRVQYMVQQIFRMYKHELHRFQFRWLILLLMKSTRKLCMNYSCLPFLNMEL